jgi:hypothetical protein
MIPTYFLELADTNVAKDVYKKYFNDQYPETNSCIELDKQIASIQKDLDEIKKRELAGQAECNCMPFIKVPCSPKNVGSCNFTGYKRESNPDWRNGILNRSKSKTYLEQMLITKKNLVALADCRNQIETVRQEETAQVFTDTSAKAETRVLTDTKNKQYLLIGVGAVAVLTVVYLVTRKK